jgi:hypothetical protein
MTSHDHPPIGVLPRTTAPSAPFENTYRTTCTLRPAIGNLIAQAHALSGLSQTATVGLLTELAADIRAGQPRPHSKVALHAARLDDATPPASVPVFIRSRLAKP